MKAADNDFTAGIGSPHRNLPRDTANAESETGALRAPVSQWLVENEYYG
jgi:hypothetical protein